MKFGAEGTWAGNYCFRPRKSKNSGGPPQVYETWYYGGPELAIGNQWQWGSLTFGVVWIGGPFSDVYGLGHEMKNSCADLEFMGAKTVVLFL